MPCTNLLGVSKSTLPSALGHCLVGCSLWRVMRHWRSISWHRGSCQRRSFDVRPELVGSWSMWWWIGHRSHHIEHCVVALVGDARMQEATAHAPGALPAVVKSADWPRLGLFRPGFITIAELTFLQLRVFLPILIFVVTYLAGFTS